MGVKALLFAAMVAAALILGALAAAIFGARTSPGFAVITANNGAIWVLDTRTGAVSVCGSALAGLALAQAESQLGTHIRAMRGNGAALAALGSEIDEIDGLSRPRCSPWSRP